ncbi:hypothetical protein AVEN_162349-1 [Araneus ventricosus]|uniref:Uncharacterized protein n=1 Tax=Araneus ventricosus TaxID=182803 RepID=A0A4Y2N673_ARAVE|nr:hypothetical protein AVEN_162349-1 [Araneus ventricosus]
MSWKISEDICIFCKLCDDCEDKITKSFNIKCENCILCPTCKRDIDADNNRVQEENYEENNNRDQEVQEENCEENDVRFQKVQEENYEENDGKNDVRVQEVQEENDRVQEDENDVRLQEVNEGAQGDEKKAIAENVCKPCSVLVQKIKKEG